MISPIEAIKLGIKEYDGVYANAIERLWQHETVIAGVNVKDWLIAQAVQESRFNSMATSQTGAKGIAQFMPKTVLEVGEKLIKLEVFDREFNPRNDGQSIYAQVYYMNYLYGQWTLKRSSFSKMQLALASYNAGLGSLLKAQRKAENARHFIEIKRGLKKVTGRNSKETISYVSKITSLALIVDDYRQESIGATYSL